MFKILIWGIGERTNYYIRMGYFNNCDIRGFICTNKTVDLFYGKNVYSVDELKQIQNDIDYIVIANEFFEEIIEDINKKGLSTEKIVMTDNIPLKPYSEYYSRLQKLDEELYELLEKTPYILTKANESDSVDKIRLMGTGKYKRSIYSQDYYRYRTFELLYKEIIENNVNGSVAELGVFRGHFSSLINEHFKDRTLYLFDTFEGFEDEEAKREIESGRCEERFIEEHKDTSIDRMFANIPYPQNVVVCKGFFPSSITDDVRQEKFAFVSLDVDFEESMLEGLRFFYPRMSEGGVIFVHDYNTFFLEGIKKAVKKFEEELGDRLKSIPLADRAGTLVIIK